MSSCKYTPKETESFFKNKIEDALPDIKGIKHSPGKTVIDIATHDQYNKVKKKISSLNKTFKALGSNKRHIKSIFDEDANTIIVEYREMGKLSDAINAYNKANRESEQAKELREFVSKAKQTLKAKTDRFHNGDIATRTLIRKQIKKLVKILT